MLNGCSAESIYHTLSSARRLQVCNGTMSDLDGTIFAYDYGARLAYVMTFDNPDAHNFLLRHPHVSYGCRGSNLHDTIWREVMTFASCAL